MAKVGDELFRRLGARFYFKRNDSGSTKFPMLDLGVMSSLTPNFTIESAQVDDGDSGTVSTTHKEITKFEETYDAELKNVSLQNMAMAYNASPPAAFTQTAQQHTVAHYAHVGGMVKLVDSSGTALYSLSTIAGVLSAPVSSGVLSTVSITAMSASAKTITTGSDISSDLSAGDQIVVQATGLANVLNSATYTVVSATTTTITVEETPTADEAAITGSLIYAASGDSGTIYNEGTDWSASSVDVQRGFVRMIDGGAFAADANVTVVFSTAAITGKRKFNPQDLTGELKGRGYLYLSSSGNAEQTIREFDCTVESAGMNVDVEDFSTVSLSITVLTDTAKTEKAGTLLHFLGDLAALS